ncbi:hypothetical protein [uncultured Draconibacterium sp.]|uniref:hypothetical protein n=1 Tax=uncultured Draconibacterium sp. TaxID=1573823 RepID=UPI003217DA51
MNDNDKNLKAMWNKAENLAGASNYESSTIERFLSGRSVSIAHGIRKMIFMDIALKTLVIIVLAIDIFLYLGTANVTTICVLGIVLLALLIWYQFQMLNRFSEIADNGQTTREKLGSMLTYLRTRFYSTLLTISSTYLFVFIAGTLVYFYSTYGQVRPMDGQDIIVFTGFIIAGIVFNFIVNKAQIKYQVKHLELCLSDLNDDALNVVSNNIVTQQKQDRINKVFLMLVLVIGFVLLIALFKNAGFIVK